MSSVSVFQPEATGALFEEKQYGAVRYRIAWSDEWRLLPYVVPIESVHRAAPGISQAKLMYHFGNIKREDRSAFEVYGPLPDLAGAYIRLDKVDQYGTEPRWYGIVDDDALDLHGARDYPQGDQTFRANGLEQLLERMPLRRAKAWQASATITIGRIPTFNHRPTGTGLQGNRSTEAHTDDVFEFSNEGAVWNAKQVAESLLAWHLPDDWPPFQLGGQVDELAKIERVWAFHEGTTLREALNRLIDRRRGLGWVVRVGDAGGVAIWVYTILDAPIAVGSTFVGANNDVAHHVLDDAIDIDKALVTNRVSGRYRQVVVQGRPVTSVFTVSFTDSNLEIAAPGSLLTEYKNASKDAEGYSALPSPEAKAAWNDAFRGDEKFNALGAFRIPSTWDAKSGNGLGGTKAFILPSVKDDGTLDTTTAAPLFRFGKQLLPMLPGLFAGWDYSTNPPVDNNPAGSEAELRKPLMLIKDGELYRYLDKQAVREESKTDIPNASVRMADGGLGFQIDIRPRHWLFKNHWSGAEPSFLAKDFSFDSTEALDYEDIVATVAVDGDERVRVVAGGGEGNGETLIITLDDAQLCYLAPNTVVGIDAAGALKHSPDEGVLLIDDRARLEATAALAWAWYQKPRAQVVLSGEGLHAFSPVGALLKSVSSADASRDVGTVVTSERIDWKGRSTRIETSYAGLGFSDLSAEIPTKRQLVGEIQTIKAAVSESREKGGRGGAMRYGVASMMLAASVYTAALTDGNVVQWADKDVVLHTTSEAQLETLSFASGEPAVFTPWTKLFLKFAKPIQPRSPQLGLFPFLYSSAGPTISIEWEDMSALVQGYSVSAGIRCSPVLTDWDPDALTWNNQGDLTLGSQIVLEQFFQSFDFNQNWEGDEAPELVIGDGSSRVFSAAKLISTPSIVYGLAVEAYWLNIGGGNVGSGEVAVKLNLAQSGVLYHHRNDVNLWP